MIKKQLDMYKGLEEIKNINLKIKKPMLEWRILLTEEIHYLNFDEKMNLVEDYINKVCINVCDSREEGKGNFKYYNRGITKEEHEKMDEIELLLWKEYLETRHKEDRLGYCQKRCYDCEYPRIKITVKDSRHWDHKKEYSPPEFYCQYECECK